MAALEDAEAFSEKRKQELNRLKFAMDSDKSEASRAASSYEKAVSEEQGARNVYGTLTTNLKREFNLLFMHFGEDLSDLLDSTAFHRFSVETGLFNIWKNLYTLAI